MGLPFYDVRQSRERGPRERPGAGAGDGHAVHEWRLERLQLTARLLASFPELKALFETTDAATIRDFLRHVSAAESRYAAARGARAFRHAAGPH